MTLQKATVNGVACVVDSGAPTTPVSDVTGDGGDIIAGVAALLANRGIGNSITGLWQSTGTGAVSALALGTNVATFLATPSSANLASAITDETGSGALVFANTPTLTSPILGTPTSGTLTNCTLPVGGLTGLGTGVATFLATPSSANLASAITDETGSGALVFGTSPTLVTPTLGVASATTLKTGDGTVNAPSHTFSSEATTGLYLRTSGVMTYAVGGFAIVESFFNGGAAGFRVAASAAIGWGSSNADSGYDTIMTREGAGIIASRNAANNAYQYFKGLLRTHQNAVAETITADHTIVIYDGGGTAYRVPCRV